METAVTGATSSPTPNRAPDPAPGPAERRARRRGRTLLVVLALLFMGPMAFSYLYHRAGFQWHPAPHLAGTLIDPPPRLALPAPAGAPVPWKLVVAFDGPCQTDCQARLHTLHQLHTALGRYAAQFERVYLGAGSAGPPDPRVRAVADTDGALRATLSEVSGDQPAAFYLADPGNFVIVRYPVGYDARGALHDLTRLARRVKSD